MNSLGINNSSELIIKKSRFITYLYKVQNIDELNNYLDKIKDIYSDATHICYAYIVDNNIKCSDDNEPSGTAGKPILNVLLKNKLNFCLAIVIRYFGGTKLGSNGLIRAYTKGIVECLKENKIIELEKGYKIRITVSYDKQKLLNNLIKDYLIKEKIFEDNLIYLIESDQSLLDILKFNKIGYIIIENIYIEKKN